MIRFDLYLEKDSLKELKALAKQDKVSVAEVIRKAVDRWVGITHESGEEEEKEK